MKGQFFVVATVIMIITLMSLVRYFYSFSGINLTQLKEISEVEYVPYIKQSLDDTISSYNGDCSKFLTDLDYTKTFLESLMIERGMTLEIEYHGSCPSITYDFNITTNNVKIETT